MKTERAIVRTLEQRFFRKLRAHWKGRYSFVTGHVCIVHARRWWAVYLYAPEHITDKQFEPAVKKADAIMTLLLREIFGVFQRRELCKTDHNRGKTCETKDHFYWFWIPVKPNRKFAIGRRRRRDPFWALAGSKSEMSSVFGREHTDFKNFFPTKRP